MKTIEIFLKLNYNIEVENSVVQYEYLKFNILIDLFLKIYSDFIFWREICKNVCIQDTIVEK